MKFRLAACLRRDLARASVIVSLAMVTSQAVAQTLTWDTTPGTAGVQNGSGTWNLTTNNWIDSGNANQIWQNTGSEIAQFGSTTPASASTVSIANNINLKGINFLALGTATPTAGQQYTLNGATAGTVLNFGNDGLIQLADFSSGGSQFVNFSTNLSLTASNLTVQKSAGTVQQFINFSMAANPNLTGTLTVGSNVYLGVSTSATISALSKVVVQTNGTLTVSGSGTTYAMPMEISGFATGTSNYGAIRINADNVNLSGGITLTGNAGIHTNYSTSSGLGFTGSVISAPITDGGNNFEFHRFALTRGNGTLALSAANTYGGKTVLGRGNSSSYNGGTTILDFSAATAPVQNILYNGLATPGGLDVVGGNTSTTLILTGKAATTNSQSLGALAVSGTRSVIQLNSGTGGQMNLSVGAITRSGSGLLAMVGPASGSISTTQADGFLGPWATYTTATGGTTWAQVVAGKVTADFKGTSFHSTGTALVSDVNAHLGVTTASTGNITQASATTNLGTLSLADTLLERTVPTGTGSTLRLGVTGGVQLTSDARSATLGQSGSFLSAGGATNNTAGQLILTNNSSSATLTIQSGLTNNGTGAVTILVNGVAGSNTILAGPGTFTGGTTIASGGLEVRHATALGSSGTITVIDGGSLRFSGGVSFSRPLTLNGLGTGAATDASLRNFSDNNTLSGLVTLNAPARILSDSGTLTFQAASATTNAISGSFVLTMGGTGDVVVNGRVAIGTLSLTKTGNGMLVLNGDNNFTGAVTISGGVLRATHANALGTGTTLGSTTVNASTALEVAGGVTLAAEPVTLSSTGINNAGGLRNISGTNTITGLITLGATTTRIHSDAGKLVFDTASGGSIQNFSSATTSSRTLIFGGAGDTDVLDPVIRQGTGNFILQKEGNGVLRLATTVANTAINLYAGTLHLDYSASTSPASSLVHNGVSAPSDLTINGGTLLITGKNGQNVGQTFGQLVPTGASTTYGGSSYLTVAQNGATSIDLTFGNISRGFGGILGLTRPTTGTLKTTGGADNQVLISGLGMAYMWILDPTNGDHWAGTTALSAGLRDIVPLSQLTTGGYTASTATTLAGNADIAAGVGTITLAASTTITTLRFAQPQTTLITQSTTGRVLTTSGILVSSTVGAFTQTISTSQLRVPDSASNNDFPIIQNNTAAPLVISSAIINQGGGLATTLSKAGPGTLVLTGANTFSGNIRVYEGTLHLQAGSISASTEFLLGSGEKSAKIILGTGATAYNTTVDWLQVMGTGTDNRIVGGATVISTLTVDNPTTANNFRTGFLGGPGTNENNLALTVNDLSTTGGAQSPMLLPLGPANTYGGQTQIRNGTVETSLFADKNIASSLGTGASNEVIELGGAGGSTIPNILAGIRHVGTVDSSTNRPLQIANSVASGVLSITAFLENNGTGALKFTAPFTSTGTNTAATRLLRLGGTNSGANEIVGINDNGSRVTDVEKTGAGTWIITGDSLHTGATTVSNGKLQLGKGGTTGSVGSAAISLTAGTSVLAMNRSDTHLLPQAITGAGRLEISNASGGTTRLTSNGNTWTGGTVVNSGTLLANNTSIESSATGTGSVTVNPGAVLGGTGRIALAANESIRLVAATLSIGDLSTSETQAAALTLQTSGSGMLSLLGGSKMSFDLTGGAGAGNNTADRSTADLAVIISAMLLGTDATLQLLNPNGMTGFASGDRWKLFDWSGLSGPVSGTFSSYDLPSLSGGLTWDTSLLFTDGTLGIVMVPEPSRAVLLMLALAGVALKRRRR